MKIGNALAALCLILATPCFAGPEHKELAGRYHLNGVMEVGSELLLMEDGSYEWFISYGSVDQFSKGTWRVEGSGVQLIASKSASGLTPVTLAGAYDWSTVAEYRLRKNVAALDEEKRALRCPSLTMGDSAYSSAAPGSANANDAAAALKPLVALRIAAEKAAELSAQTPSDKAIRAASDAAVKAFWDQYKVARDLSDGAGVEMPDVALPQAAVSCQRVDVEIRRNIPVEEWTGQQAVVVFDPALDLAIGDVTVRIDYANGKFAEGRTDGRGAFLPIPQMTADVTQVTLAYPKAQLLPVVIPISRKGRVLVMLDFDYRAVAPAFEKMLLTLDKSGLNPEGGGQGVYVR